MIIMVGYKVGRTADTSIIRVCGVDDAVIASGKIINNDMSSIKDLTVAAVKAYLSKGITIEGLKLEKEKLVGSNGSLDRYGSLDYADNSAMVVIAKYNRNGSDCGYCISNATGKIKNYTEENAIKYASACGIANGKLVEKDGRTFISSINGEYASVSLIAEANNGNNKRVEDAVVKKEEAVVKKEETVVATASENKIKIPSSNNEVTIKEESKHLVPKIENPIGKPVASSIEEWAKQDRDLAHEFKRVDGNAVRNGADRQLKDSMGVSVGEKMAIALLTIKKMNLFVYSFLGSMDHVACGPDSNIGTLGVSPFTMTLYYNCNYVNSISTGQLMFALIHEAYHILFKHALRQKERNHKMWNIAGDFYINKLIAEQFGIDKIYPQASLIDPKCDFVSNPNFETPKTEFDKYIEGAHGWLWNPNIDTTKDTAETIYDDLMRAAEQQQQQQGNNQSGERSDSDDSGNNSSSNNGEDNSNNEDSSSDNSNGGAESENNGTSTESNSANGDNSDSSNESDESSEDDNNGKGESNSASNSEENRGNELNSGSSDSESDSNDSENGSSSNSLSDNSEENGGSEGSGSENTESGRKASDDSNGNKNNKNSSNNGDRENSDNIDFSEYDDYDTDDIVNDTGKDVDDLDMKKAAEEKLKQSIMTASAAVKMAGSEISPELKRLINDIIEPKVDFRVILRQLLNKQTTHNMSWKRTGKRGELAPGIDAPGRLKNQTDGLTRAVFAIDSSGSMNDDELMFAFGYIKKLCEQMEVELELVFWNTVVSNSYPVKGVKDLIKVKETGTGGTDIKCLFEYLAGHTEVQGKKRKEKTDVLIVVTDGCFSANYSKYKRLAKSVVWILVDKNSYYSFEPLFGKKAPLDIRLK